MAEKYHIDKGIRKILEVPAVYNFFQSIIGANKHRINYFKKNIPLSDNLSILDIGCGTALLSEYISGNPSIQYIGCDMEETYIKFAREKRDKNHTFIREKVGENERLEWVEKFDIINAHGLLHHLSDDESNILLNSCHKYLKKDGYLLTVDSVFHSDQNKLEKWLVSKDRGQNIKNPEEYVSFLKQYFKDVKFKLDNEYSQWLPYSVFIMKSFK